MSSKEIIKILKKNGWYFVASNGSHFHYKHAIILGKVTVPHPRKDIDIKTLESISKHSGIKF
ncbi:type II toxin-antitoxin system HicA family toxin [uncultured Sneathia sp.]|jgi:hypothetical protein|uniref:type II toxin-antitoxin system HicA family toxin n=1 Tax=uncultured Sneathia sp. TaxID=278067 RepID=UPI0025970070|nr:type II toxin-antitoxin system HicA family toxin [uncultured Sneathia sp.]